MTQQEFLRNKQPFGCGQVNDISYTLRRGQVISLQNSVCNFSRFGAQNEQAARVCRLPVQAANSSQTINNRLFACAQNDLRLLVGRA